MGAADAGYAVDRAPNSHGRHDRASWARLRRGGPLTLDEAVLAKLRGGDEPTALAEIEEIYLPLARWITPRVTAARSTARRPFVLAIAGSVAVGKSTTARLLQALLARCREHPCVELVTTDGFLYPRAELERRGLLARKGFPESYDLRRMIDFLTEIRTSGCGVAPLYSHHAYDRIPGEKRIRNPDILIIEGLNVLQIGAGFCDLSIYIDAETPHIARWYEERFLLLQKAAFQQSASPFHHLAHAPVEKVQAEAHRLWTRINAVNLVENILPSRARADVILHKGSDHTVEHLWLRHEETGA